MCICPVGETGIRVRLLEVLTDVGGSASGYPLGFVGSTPMPDTIRIIGGTYM